MKCDRFFNFALPKKFFAIKVLKYYRLLASAGRDGTIRIWDVAQGISVRTLSGHTASVTCIKWGGCGLLYSCSQV